MNDLEKVLGALEENWEKTQGQMISLCRIPGISRFQESWKDIERSGELIAGWMREIGLENVEVIHFPGAPPYVYGDWLHAATKGPTALLYAHHDVQPIGDPSRWTSPPFEPSVRNGRLYGRGTVDDKSGVLVHLGAIESYLKTSGSLPLNIKFIVDGEEETGSKNLGSFLQQYREKLRADLLCLTDCSNLETGLPSLTYSLRGLTSVHVKVKTLRQPLHSGMWGGVLPDAALTLSKLLATLVDDQGRIRISGFYEDVEKIPEWEKRNLMNLPWNEAKTRKEAQVVDHLRFLGDPQWGFYERQWSLPSLAILAVKAGEVATAPNQIVPEAEAIVSCRLAPGQDPKSAQDRLVRHLEENCPFGAELSLKRGIAAAAWKRRPEGPHFEAAKRALTRGFGKEAVLIGCGGIIPFVRHFQQIYGDLPALLFGLEDPPCNAHGEDESIDLSDFKKGARSMVYLYDEIARLSL